MDKNLKANANSKNANIFFTVSNQPPDLGKLCNHCGNIANKVKGNANATPNPAIPCVKAHAPPCSEPTNKVPKIGPVQEKDTIAKVMAIKKMPPILPSPLFESALLAIPLGKEISKNPKNEILKTINITKKLIFNHGLVEILLKISGCTFPTI